MLLVGSVVTSFELWRKLDKVGAACRREGELLGISGGFVIKLVPAGGAAGCGAHRSRLREWRRREKSNAASAGRKMRGGLKRHGRMMRSVVEREGGREFVGGLARDRKPGDDLDWY